MPIRPYLDGQKFDLETTRLMGIAFEMARVGLGLSDRDELAKEIVAKRALSSLQKQVSVTPIFCAMTY